MNGFSSVKSWAWILAWLFVGSGLLALPSAAVAAGALHKLLGADAEQALMAARLARVRLDFTGAVSKLDQAVQADPQLEARVVHERGLVAEARGELEQALVLLARAAELDRTSSARVDEAGVLVHMGRWPEAVTVLARALEERGPGLAVSSLVRDRRFVRLTALQPYQALIATTEREQSSATGQILIRLERLQNSVSAAEYGWQRLRAWSVVAKDLLTSPAVALAAFLLLSLLMTVGITELGLLGPPYTVGLGVVLTTLVWLGLGHWLGGGSSQAAWPGSHSAGVGLSCLGGVWGSVRLGRFLWWRRRLARVGRADPLVSEHLPDTLVMVDEVSRLGHRLIGSRHVEPRALIEALRAAAETLRERLDKGARP